MHDDRPYRRYRCPECGREDLTQEPLRVFCSKRCVDNVAARRHYRRHREEKMAYQRVYRARKKQGVA